MSTVEGSRRGYGIVRDGLVLYLDASSPNSYNSNFGPTTWKDISGNGNNGTLVNGPVYSSTNGGSIVFDGSDDYVSTNYITNSTAFTYCVWGKSSSTGYPNRILGNANALNGLSGAGIIWGMPAINRIWFTRRIGLNNSTRDIITSDISNFSGNWHYIVATYDSVNGSKLYCDNILVGSNTTTGFISSLNLNIGRDGNGADAFRGDIPSVQIYNRALSAAEVLQNYNATKSRFGL